MNTPTPLWVASTSMGYGHLRAVHPFEHRAHNGVIDVADTTNTSKAEKRQWARYQNGYETISRAHEIPVIGKRVFGVLDKLLHIPSFYPIRNLSKTTYQVDMLYRQIGKGLGRGFIETVQQAPYPILSSFYVSSIAADINGLPDIHTIICDADLNRVWAARESWDSSIKYFAPCGKAAQRLKSYGVPEDHIFITGFPLDDSLLGGRGLATLKRDLAIRLQVLDPTGRFHLTSKHSVEHFLGDAASTPVPNNRVLTITYAVGGAGAQTSIGIELMKSLRDRLNNGTVSLKLVAGIREDVRDTFEKAKTELLEQGARVEVVYRPTLGEYFSTFNDLMHTTDILWTKPSELSFYTGLGMPIIMAPKIGSQEKFNRKWLLEIGSGIKQEKPEHADDWVFSLLENGKFADMAWLGFLRARKLGYHHMSDVLAGGDFSRSDNPLER